MRSHINLVTRFLQAQMPTYQHRFFSYMASAPVEIVKTASSPQAIQKLAAHQRQKQILAQHQYPTMLSRIFQHQIVYTLRSESPEEMLAKGGLIASGGLGTDLEWSPDNGNNRGFVCFSLLPEVASIFTQKKISSPHRNAYMYAFPLTGLFWLPGGPWRQICSPGAFPLPEWWRARKVLDVEHQTIDLGKTTGQGNAPANSCESFKSYMENTVRIPLLLNVADEDYPEVYDITDTAESAKFQQQVAEYYKQKKTHRPGWDF